MKLKLHPIILTTLVAGLTANTQSFAADNQSLSDSSTTTIANNTSNSSSNTDSNSFFSTTVTNQDNDSSVAELTKIMNFSQAGANVVPSKTWFNHFRISGLTNIDTFTSNRSDINPSSNEDNRYLNQATSNIQLTNANLFFQAIVNDWVSGMVDVGYDGRKLQLTAPLINADDQNRFKIKEGYVSIANLSASPIYARIGKQYLDFGDIRDHYPITYSLTDLMAEINEPAIDVGFVRPSMYGSVAIFESDLRQGTTANSLNQKVINSATVNAGYILDTASAGHYQANIGYLSNLPSNNYFSDNWVYKPDGSTLGYTNTVGAYNVKLSGKYNKFDADAQFISAIQRFNVNDMEYGNTGNGAKPWAASTNLGYSFRTGQHDSRFGVSYQWSGQAFTKGFIPSDQSDHNDNIVSQLPKTRMMAEYDLHMMYHTLFALQAYRDHDYSVSVGATGKYSTTAVARLGVEFV